MRFAGARRRGLDADVEAPAPPTDSEPLVERDHLSESVRGVRKARRKVRLRDLIRWVGLLAVGVYFARAHVRIKLLTRTERKIAFRATKKIIAELKDLVDDDDYDKDDGDDYGRKSGDDDDDDWGASRASPPRGHPQKSPGVPESLLSANAPKPPPPLRGIRPAAPMAPPRRKSADDDDDWGASRANPSRGRPQKPPGVPPKPLPSVHAPEPPPPPRGPRPAAKMATPRRKLGNDDDDDDELAPLRNKQMEKTPPLPMPKIPTECLPPKCFPPEWFR